MGVISVIKTDLKANTSNTKGKFIVIFFRLANYFAVRKRNPLLFILGLAFRFFYKFQIQWIMGVDLAEKTKVGKGLCIFHGQGLIVNEDTLIGEFAVLRQNTTIGNKTEGGPSPVFGDYVNIGANAVVLGGVTIGNHVTIGAGSVVIKDLPSGATAVGNPAKIIKTSIQ